jgi:hypothetical protein
MIYDKEKIKKRMIEFTSNYFWKHDQYPRFKDFQESFGKNVFLDLSDGSISNYLKELIFEKRLQKKYDGITTYYILPKKHVTTKFIIVFSSSIIMFLALLVIINISFFFYLVSFYLGGLFVWFSWFFYSKKSG